MNTVRISRGRGLAVLLLLLLLGLAAALLMSRPFAKLVPHFAGSCRMIALGASAADLRIDRPRQLAYLSYLDRRAVANGEPVQGTVMLVDLGAPDPRPRAALNHEPAGFRPQGMSLYAPPEGAERLFVVSDPAAASVPSAASGAAGTSAAAAASAPTGPTGPTVEIFEQSRSGGFTPVETLRDALLVAPRALLAVGPRQFYVSNDPSAHARLGRILERLLHRGTSTVDYYDGSTMRPVLTGLAAASGLAASPDGRRLYVSEALARRIDVYTRDAATGGLALERRIDLGSEPDALDVDPQGDLWVAAHPRPPPPWRERGRETDPEPTQVVRISPQDWRPVEVYLSLGDPLSAGSAAAVVEKTLLIGSVTDRALLRCTLP